MEATPQGIAVIQNCNSGSVVLIRFVVQSYKTVVSDKTLSDKTTKSDKTTLKVLSTQVSNPGRLFTI